ncbi:MAG: bifunctional pyr operon transcriptional regulator/uracil phosphoribosyltransferase PyrR [Phycisphaerae bacterium]|nr:bifunctional pyr operon transcriptional regulator/uracil phosphoribosyltransferase PyrR [Phycisphaerae bacterium]
MRVWLNEQEIAAALDRIADAVAASIPAGADVALIGIRSRGDVIARRLRERLQARGVRDVPIGTLDITLYRDDLAEIGPNAVVRTTEIDFDVSDRYVVLVDDVIFTGRSIRSALDAIIDLGRPRAIRLAVLVDRGGRELPIQPDFVGATSRDPREHVRVLLRECDGVDRVEGGS